MRQELEQRLFEDFPLLYKHHKDPEESCLCFGFECMDGWYQLIRSLSEDLYPLLLNFHSDDPEAQPVAVQVKEKYGGLRFYMSLETNEMSDIIRAYEERSIETCEICGEKGEIDFNSSWYECRCEKHRDK